MLTIQTCVVMLLTMTLNVSGILFQQPGPTSTPTTSSATSASIPTSPASATDAALGATSTALAATSAALAATTTALLSRSPNSPTGQTPRQLPSTGGEDMPWRMLAGLTLLLLVAGAWLRYSATSCKQQHR